MEDLLPTYLIHNAYSAVERSINPLAPYNRPNYKGSSTKSGQHSSKAHTKARKAKRRLNRKH